MQQLTTATDKVVVGCLSQSAQMGLAALSLQAGCRFPYRDRKELGIGFILIQYGHKPVLQRQGRPPP